LTSRTAPGITETERPHDAKTARSGAPRRAPNGNMSGFAEAPVYGTRTVRSALWPLCDRRARRRAPANTRYPVFALLSITTTLSSES
jgi:hypothetical protein